MGTSTKGNLYTYAYTYTYVEIRWGSNLYLVVAPVYPSRLIMPIALDQWGWDEADAVLYIGIVMVAGGVMAGFCYASIGPLAKRFDERLIMLICGIIPMTLGRFVVFPYGDQYPAFAGNASDTCPGEFDPNAQSEEKFPADYFGPLRCR